MLPEELEEGIQRSSTEETPTPTSTAPLPLSPKQYATSLFDNPIDLSQKHGVIAYNEGCEPLDLDNKFEGKISQIAPFLDAVLERMQRGDRGLSGAWRQPRMEGPDAEAVPPGARPVLD